MSQSNNHKTSETSSNSQSPSSRSRPTSPSRLKEPGFVVSALQQQLKSDNTSVPSTPSLSRKSSIKSVENISAKPTKIPVLSKRRSNGEEIVSDAAGQTSPSGRRISLKAEPKLAPITNRSEPELEQDKHAQPGNASSWNTKTQADKAKSSEEEDSEDIGQTYSPGHQALATSRFEQGDLLMYNINVDMESVFYYSQLLVTLLAFSMAEFCGCGGKGYIASQVAHVLSFFSTAYLMYQSYSDRKGKKKLVRNKFQLILEESICLLWFITCSLRFASEELVRSNCGLRGSCPWGSVFSWVLAASWWIGSMRTIALQFLDIDAFTYFTQTNQFFNGSTEEIADEEEDFIYPKSITELIYANGRFLRVFQVVSSLITGFIWMQIIQFSAFASTVIILAFIVAVVLVCNTLIHPNRFRPKLREFLVLLFDSSISFLFTILIATVGVDLPKSMFLELLCGTAVFWWAALLRTLYLLMTTRAGLHVTMDDFTLKV